MNKNNTKNGYQSLGMNTQATNKPKNEPTVTKTTKETDMRVRSR